ncbi:hypothetical protein GCM10011609_06650 [Lentzea pudingi]|uniref:Uncharacterized protein n=1 Tax=Lentzea pudingi TaxID=1789439 RepID=A0ABQ2HAQ8_9PSEU|nr:hypothetical protein [Lentzea pudingi]GGM73519.1 hypothetical protein GCM10011609_06650 [Lentzea pudingi]
MTPLIIPPLLDHTVDFRDGATGALDLNAHFLSRAARDFPTGSDPLTALFAAASAQILVRPERGFAHLRALTFAVRAMGAADPALRTAADDVEIVGGTTESSADVRSAAARSTLFAPEVEHALETFPSGPVAVLVETDQQLPAAVALANRLGPLRVRLCGTFAHTHRTVLMEMLPGARVSPTAPPMGEVRGEWSGGEPVAWPRHPRDWRPGRPWAAWWDASAASTISSQAAENCRGLVVTAARWESDDRVTGADGAVTDLSALGVLPAVELLVGAPGVGAGEVSRTARALAAEGRLAGLRPFRLGTGPDHWEVTRLPAPTGHDLPRWSPFTAPATMTRDECDAVIRDLLLDTASLTELFPGRFAGCAVLRGAERSRWNSSAAVVTTDGTGPDGRGPGDFVVNLRSGSAFRLHPKLAPVVRRLSRGDHAVLDRLPHRTRGKLSDQLVRAGAWQAPA